MDKRIVYNPYDIHTRLARTYEELNAKLIQLTGYDIKQLVEKFAAGYTLEPPKYNSNLMSAMEDGEN